MSQAYAHQQLYETVKVRVSGSYLGKWVDTGDGVAELGWQALLAAGINDWGGISPLTRDYVNPEAAWPHLHALAAATAAAGKALVPR